MYKTPDVWVCMAPDDRERCPAQATLRPLCPRLVGSGPHSDRFLCRKQSSLLGVQRKVHQCRSCSWLRAPHSTC